ncbi:hypothetical protein [Aminobacter sp. AP02]|uniref:hypothetical protein n=1 Tax=Aminobacter sp. AP02 TaxID=2135737 RepID=UPI000D7A228C|nr:hypothetical protein [Aminobacter sp. AP02]PWK67508.1 hypothetical protein C8K44_11260 [Aminobacter sp. AP02]
MSRNPVAIAMAIFVASSAAAQAAPNSKYQKGASYYDSCWKRTADKAIAKGTDAKKAAKKANSHCKKLSKKLLSAGGSKYDIKDRQRSLRQTID